MAELYAVELEEQERIDLAHFPLTIDPPYDLGYPYRWNLEGYHMEGSANRAFEPLLTNVRCEMQNFRWTQTKGYGPVDNNPGRLLWACYENAFALARHRFNLRVLADRDTEWGDTHLTATPMHHTLGRGINAQHGVIDQYPVNMTPDQRRHRRPFSMVRARIENMPVIVKNNDSREDRSLVSDNVFIRPNDNMFTVRRLYTSMARKYFWNENEGTSQVGSEPELVFPTTASARRDSIIINFQFMFVKGANWRPVEGQFRTSIQKNRNLFRPIPTRASPIRRQAIDYNIGALSRASASAASPRPRTAVSPGQIRRRRRDLPPPNHNVRNLRPRVGGDDTVGIYTKLKERLYVKRSLEDFFSYSKACISVPTTQEEICFPMAFMRCQLRTWTHKVVAGHVLGEMISIEEDNCYPLNIEFTETVPRHRASFFDGETIKVFDNTKRQQRRVGSRGRTHYINEAKDLSEEEIDLWKWCAYQMHYFVEGVWGKEIELQDLDECMRAYCYVFQVNIAVFAIEMKGERIMLETVGTGEKLEKDNFVGLLIQNSHVHAISSMRHYQRSQLNPLGTSLHTYCDYCNTMCYSRTKEFTHTNKCCKGDWKLCDSLDTLHAKEASKTEIRQKFIFLKKDKYQDICLSCYRLAKDCTSCVEAKTRSAVCVQCKTCMNIVPLNYFNYHDCYMKARKPKERLADDKIFVYDIESMQTYDKFIDQHIHECILVCLRAVYDDRRWKFESIPEFVRFLIDNKEMHGSTILAHNGGGYDHQFVLRYLEDSGIMHTTTPRPNTLHKYLMIEIAMQGENSSIKFLDFLMMMTDSLRNIGKAFKLDACKGDFPHRFSKPEHLNYDGRLPALDAEEDWYGFKEIKNPNELAECREYWNSQAQIYCTCDGTCFCSKKKWNFKQQLEDYCWLDVDVLAGACKAYRDQALNFSGSSDFSWSTNGIEPFQYMTQSQIALALFMQGKEQNNIAITHEKIRPSFRPAQILWMENLMSLNGQLHIQHAGNSFKEYYDVDTRTYLDGYCHNTRTVFEYLDCKLDGCPTCYAGEIERKEFNDARNLPWHKVCDETQKRLQSLRANNLFERVEVRWSHDDEGRMETGDEEVGNVMKLRDFFYGGRTEVFSAYADADKFPNEEIMYHDVCSLYPYVCSLKELPLGVPTIYFNKAVQKERLHPSHPNKYFGFARIKVRPNKHDLVAILPQRIKLDNGDEKLVYDLHDKTGCWHTELIYLAIEHGYVVDEVYEVWHWEDAERSATLMRGYMEFFLRMKQEADGWGKLGMDYMKERRIASEAALTEEDKNNIADIIKSNNGGFARPRVDKVEKNPILRQLAKIFLNCLWGKLCQKNASEYERFVYGYKQYLEMCSNPMINLASIKFRHVNGCVFKVRYELNDTLQETNRFLNVCIAASVTSHAQRVLMEQMFKVGPERILYCDTDSIVFIRQKGLPRLDRTGLGNWEDEYPGKRIRRFWALAPKCYMLEVEDSNELDYLFKCKGVRGTEENRRNTTFDKIHELVEHEFLGEKGHSIMANTMTIHPNSTNSDIPYGTLCTRYGTKKIQIVFSKREMITNSDEKIKSLSEAGFVRLLPFGYQGPYGNSF